MKVVLDADTRAKLHGLTEQLELYDEAGKLVGVVLPPFVYEALRSPAAFGPFTDAEIDRAFAQTDPGRPLEAVLADLRKL